jgi:GNAT superfamily N-acetyltransferase
VKQTRKRTLDELSDEDVVRLSELNYIAYWTNACRFGNAEFTDDKGITYCITGLQQEILNVILKCNLDEEVVESRIDDAIKYFRTKKIPMTWHTGLTTRPRNIGMYLEARGFPHDYDLIAMAVDMDRLNEQFTSKGCVEIVRVNSADQSRNWTECLVSSWDSPKEAVAWFHGNEWFNAAAVPSGSTDLPRRTYLGSVDGKPAATAMINWDKDVVGLQAIGTIPSERYKGVGTATILAALKDARALGYKFAVVLSTTEGVRLYERVGFRVYGKLPEHSLHFERV